MQAVDQPGAEVADTRGSPFRGESASPRVRRILLVVWWLALPRSLTMRIGTTTVAKYAALCRRDHHPEGDAAERRAYVRVHRAVNEHPEEALRALIDASCQLAAATTHWVSLAPMRWRISFAPMLTC